MDMIKRAAQFAPFAALTGYGDAVDEAARLTDEMVSLGEDAVEELDRRLSDAARSGREVAVTYFVPDEKKAGGRYERTVGIIKKLQMGMIILEDGQRIAADMVEKVEFPF